MMHKQRCWCVAPVPSPEELARKFTEHTWTLCTGFAVAGHEEYLFLNDATSADGAAEYAIVKGRIADRTHVQLESITFSWCSYHQALQFIEDALAGRMDTSEFTHPVTVRVETPDQHQRCPLCA